MPAIPAIQPDEKWIDKAEVAKRLKVSERTVLSLVTKIKCDRRRSPESNQLVWMFDAEDVVRYSRERDNPPPKTKTPLADFDERNKPAVHVAQPSQPPALPTPDKQQIPGQSGVAFTPRPWLTLDEAAAFSGLTKRWLLDCACAIGQDDIAIRDMGKHSPGGRWRFHRDSLEKP